MKEQEVRKKVKALKGLYVEVVSFAIVNMILILIWLAMDNMDPFWPKYVMVVWGIVLSIKAYSKGILHLIFHHISFLSPEWEAKKIHELKEQLHIQRKIHLNRNVSKSNTRNS